MREKDAKITPFLKWAGGKRWFIPHLINLVPKKYSSYIEPFLGSGAVFFAIDPSRAVLSDANRDLINCYMCVKTSWKKISELLREHDKNHSKEYYYKIREKIIENSVEKAAQFIYLNRTCWNGLYRVNLQGKFNVPIGTKDSIVLDTDDFELIAHRLGAADLICCDFEESINKAGSNDFVFIDPPYTVKHNLNGFIKYNEKIFSWNDQVRLRDAAVRAMSRGAHILITNANHPSVRELYEDFPKLTPFSRRSILAADPEFRSNVEELVIQSWLS